jgi:hypothetical protein
LLNKSTINLLSFWNNPLVYQIYISTPGACDLGWNRAEKLGKTLKEAGIIKPPAEREARDRALALTSLALIS